MVSPKKLNFTPQKWTPKFNPQINFRGNYGIIWGNKEAFLGGGGH